MSQRSISQHILSLSLLQGLADQGLHLNHNFNEPLVNLSSMHVSEPSVEPLERAINTRRFTHSLPS